MPDLAPLAAFFDTLTPSQQRAERTLNVARQNLHAAAEAWANVELDHDGSLEQVRSAFDDARWQYRMAHTVAARERATSKPLTVAEDRVADLMQNLQDSLVAAKAARERLREERARTDDARYDRDHGIAAGP